MFRMETKCKKILMKKQFTHILMLESDGPFESPSLDQVLALMNEMGYYLQITLISAFRESNLPLL